MASSAKSGGNRYHNKRKVVSDEVSEVKTQLALLTSAVADLKMNTSQVENQPFKKSSLSPSTHFKMVPTHVEKPSNDDVLTEQALLIAELQTKNELLEDKFNTILGQITTFMGLCNKHTTDINELRETIMKEFSKK